MIKSVTPKISVIVPVYNVEKYIDECAKSVINQTLHDIEIIFVDDCGTDNSMAVVEKYAKNDNRIKIVKHEKNSGLSASRNTGIKHSFAPYLMFCDSDDFYSPTICQELFDAIEKSGADIAICGTNIIYECDENLKSSDDEYYRIKYTGTKKVKNEIINNCDVSAWNKIFKKSIFEKYDLRYPFGLKYEDAFLFRMYMLWAKKITFVNKKLHNYRRRAGSIMNKTFKKCDTSAIDHLKIAIECFNYMTKYKKFDENSDYFWKSIFIPYFNFARWHSSKSYQKQIFQIAYDFMDKYYNDGNFDFYTARTLDMIKNQTLEQTKKHMFGLLRSTESIDRKTYYFLVFPVYKIKIFPDYQKHYILGIQYKIKHF